MELRDLARLFERAHRETGHFLDDEERTRAWTALEEALGEAGLQRPVNSRSIRSTPRCHGGSSSPKAARSRAVSSREFRGRCAGVG